MTERTDRAHRIKEHQARPWVERIRVLKGLSWNKRMDGYPGMCYCPGMPDDRGIGAGTVKRVYAKTVDGERLVTIGDYPNDDGKPYEYDLGTMDVWLTIPTDAIEVLP